jgi:hypothetical protein
MRGQARAERRTADALRRTAVLRRPMCDAEESQAGQHASHGRMRRHKATARVLTGVVNHRIELLAGKYAACHAVDQARAQAETHPAGLAVEVRLQTQDLRVQFDVRAGGAWCVHHRREGAGRLDRSNHHRHQIRAGVSTQTLFA